MKKKVAFIVIAVIIVVIIAILTTIYLIDRSKYDFEIEKVKDINYHIIHEDTKYGVIDRNGQIVVDTEYDIIQIPNPSKDIFVCMEDYDSQKKEYHTKVLNAKSEELYQEYSNIQAIPTETTYDGIPFEKTVLKYKESEKYGLLSIDGKEITEPIYDEISAIPYKEGMLLVKQNGKCGVINIKGKQLIPIEYETITADNYYNEKSFYKTTGYIVSKKSEEGYRYGYINYKGKVILKVEYTQISRITDMQEDKNVYLMVLKDGQAGILRDKKIILNYEYEDIAYNSYNDVFVIQRNGKQGIANKKGKILIEPQYEHVTFAGIYVNAEKDNQNIVLDLNGNKLENQKIIFKMPTNDGKHFIIADELEMYDIVDENGNSIIENTYSYIEEIATNYYVVGNNNNNGVIDVSGKAVVDFKYNSIYHIDRTELFQANISTTNTVSIIDKNMKVIATMDNASVDINDKYIKLYSENESKYFDDTGKELTYMEIYPNNTLYAKNINDKWGFVDKDGNLQVQNEYEMVTEFNEYGFAGIKKDGKWGSINDKGEVVQEPIYTLKGKNPNFIGKFYQSEEWRGDSYYTDKVEED